MSVQKGKPRSLLKDLKSSQILQYVYEGKQDTSEIKLFGDLGWITCSSDDLAYHNVASHLEAHAGNYRLLMERIFDAYDKKLFFEQVGNKG